MYCRLCDIEYPKSLRFCKWCGGGLVAREAVANQHCPSCGSEIEKEWVFCNECGVDLATLGAQPRDIVCPACSATVRKGWMFCRQCGEQVATERAQERCETCGAGIRPTWHFCKQCGTGLKPEAEAQGAPFRTVAGIPALPPENFEEEPFSNLKSGELPPLEDVIRTQKRASSTSTGLPPESPRGQGDAPLAGGTKPLTTSRSTGHLDTDSLEQEIRNHPQAEPHVPTPAAFGRLEASELIDPVAPRAPEADANATRPYSAIANSPAAWAPDESTVAMESPFAATVDQAPAPSWKPAAEPRAESTQAMVSPFSTPVRDATQAMASPVAPPAPDVVEPPVTSFPDPTPSPSAAFSPESAYPAPEPPPPPRSDYNPFMTTPPQPGSYPPQQPSYPPSYPPQQPSYPPPQEAYPPSYPPQPPQPSYPPPVGQQPSYPPAQPPYPPPPPQASTVPLPPNAAPSKPFIQTQPAFSQPTGQVSQHSSFGQPVSDATHATSAPFPPPSTDPAAKGSAVKWVALGLVVLALLVVGAVGVVFAVRALRAKPEVVDTPPAPAPTPPVVTPQPPPVETPKTPVPPDGMVYVAGGTFQMGTDDPTADAYSRPAHQVEVKPYFLDAKEVTNADYLAFVGATGHAPPKDGWLNGAPAPGTETWPVVQVSWNDAVAYAKWANKRLPTESEWEFAARGTDGRRYPWGNEWDPAKGNVGKDGKNGTPAPVGSYEAGKSPCGAYDLIGNVWEWTSSPFAFYPGGTGEPPAGKNVMIMRGGAFDNIGMNTAMYRGFYTANSALPKVGFRCAKDLP